MELLDVYNDEFEVTNKVIERGSKLLKGENISLAVVIIRNKEGKYLIQKSSDKKGGYYSLTGGHVISGESPIVTIIREIKEELGISVLEDELSLASTFKYESKPCIFNVYMLDKDIDVGMFKLQEEEVDSVYFMDKEEVLELIDLGKFLETHGYIFKKFVCEYFDVVDKNRKPLGYTKIRGSLLEDNEYNMGCEIYFIHDNKLLITQRCKLKSHPLKWEVVGGCSKSGQTSLDTILTEVKEEIGININSNDIKLIDTKMYKKMFVDMYVSNKVIDITKVKLQDEEVSDIKYVTFEEFENMASKGEIVQSVYERYSMIKDKLFK